MWFCILYELISTDHEPIFIRHMHSVIELPDHRGLICGFLLCPTLPAQRLEWETLAEAFNVADGTVWLHFNLVDTRARQWINNCDRIPAAVKEMLLDMSPHNQLEVVDNGFMMVLGDLHYEFDIDPDSLGLLRIYVDQNCVITLRGRPLKAIDQLRLALINEAPIKTSLDLIVHFLEYANDIFGIVVTERRGVIDDLEDQILKGIFYEQRGELGILRRSLAKLRRHLNGNQHVLSRNLMPRLPSWCLEADVSELHRNIEHLDGLIQDLELVQERARLLQEEIAARLQETVNRNLYVLSIVTTFFLPVTLITGIFGMNVGGVPWTQEPIGIWWVLLIMSITAGVTFGALQRQKFF
jgi:zinc transporter